VARKQFAKLEQSVAKEKQAKHKKFKFLKKEYEKRETKYNDALLNSTKARNEYLLCKDAANSSIQKYFVDDLSDLIDVRITP
jgi:SLIT-ROBO Rho GTPase activating protein